MDDMKKEYMKKGYRQISNYNKLPMCFAEKWAVEHLATSLVSGN